jgi:hypothetical protein
MLDAALATYGVSPLQTHLDHQKYWKSIADAERSKPPGEQDEKLLRQAMKEEAQAARDAAPYLHGRRATVAAPSDDKPIPCVIRAPAKLGSTEEWLKFYGPGGPGHAGTQSMSMEMLEAIKKFEALDQRFIGTEGFKQAFDAVAAELLAAITARPAPKKPGGH